MLNSHRIVYESCKGNRLERIPIFDLLMNDAIIQYFSGGKLDGSHDEELVMLAASNCLDATREIRKPDTISRKWRNGQGNL